MTLKQQACITVVHLIHVFFSLFFCFLPQRKRSVGLWKRENKACLQGKKEANKKDTFYLFYFSLKCFEILIFDFF